MKKIARSVIVIIFCLVAMGLISALAPAWIVPAALCIFMAYELCRSIYVLMRRKDIEAFAVNGLSVLSVVAAMTVAATMGRLIRFWWMLTFWY